MNAFGRRFARLWVSLALLFTLSASANEESVRVDVSALALGGGSVERLYVGLIAPDRPWDAPVAETIATNGKATLRVPPGTYDVVVGAKGFEAEGAHANVAPGGNNELTFELLPDYDSSGTVVDAAGRPVRGVRVMQMRVPMSELAQRELGVHWRTETDDNGWWSMPLPTQLGMPVLIEAAGYAPAWRNHKPADKASLDVTLQRGGGLTLHVDRVDPQLVVSLTRKDDAIPVEWQSRVWGRAANATTLTWDALAPGEYRVVVRDEDHRRFTPEAELAKVTIAEGQTAEVRASLPKTAAPAARVTRLFIQGQLPFDLTALRGYARTTNGVETVPHTLQRTAKGTVVHLNTAAAESELFALSSDKIYIPRRGDKPAATLTTVATVSFPRATAKLRVTPSAETLQLPSTATAQFRDCKREQRVTLPAALAKDGTIALPFPTDCTAFVLQFEGFEPLALATAMEVGETRSLGEFSLSAAGSVEARIVRASTQAVAPGATVRAILPTTRQRMKEIVVAEGTAGDDGRIVLKSLPAGEELLLEARVQGSELTGSAHIRLEPAERFVVDPLAIPEPAMLVVEPRLDEQFRTRFPQARVLSVMVKRGGNEEASAKRTADLPEEGKVSFSQLHPGAWRVLGLVEAEGSTQPIDIAEIELTSGEVRTLKPTLKPSVFEGRVVAYGRGIAASIGIADEPAPHAIRRSVQSLADGRFITILPKPGTYYVEVRQRDGGVEKTDIGAVEFGDRPIEIVLPESTLLVRVKAGGQPVAGTNIVATLRPSGAVTVREVVRRGRTNEAGELQLDGLLEGTWIIQARHPESNRAAQKLATLQRDDATAVEVELEKTLLLGGTVRESGGTPVAGANVDCFFVGPAGVFDLGRAESKNDGRFAIELPSPAPQVLRCGVTTPRGAVGAFTTNVTESADFTLPPATASLTISDWGDKLTRDAFWLVASDGRIVSLSRVAGEIGKLWSPLVIPRLPAGNWKLVRADTLDQRAMLVRGLSGSLPPVAELQLASGEVRDVRIYQQSEIHRGTGE